MTSELITFSVTVTISESTLRLNSVLRLCQSYASGGEIGVQTQEGGNRKNTVFSPWCSGVLCLSLNT